MARGELDLDDKIDGADIDSEFERGRRYQYFHLSFFKFVLGAETQLAREQLAVMSGNFVFADSLGEMVREPFG